MSTDAIGNAVAGLRAAPQGGQPSIAGQPNREQVRQLAAQFESMLLVQMLRTMRESGKWDDDESPEAGGLGAEAFFDTIDAELAGHLTRMKGIGLSTQLVDAFEKLPGLAPVVTAPASPAAVPLETAKATMTPGPPSFAVEPGTVTSEFGWRADPFTGRSKFHRGIDVRAAYGQDIQAAGNGRVVFSGEQGSYGTTVVIEHSEGVRTRYAHLSAAAVRNGDEVASGQVVGQAGRSGWATGTHLHFEVTVNGKPVSPAEAGFVPPAGS